MRSYEKREERIENLGTLFSQTETKSSLSKGELNITNHQAAAQTRLMYDGTESDRHSSGYEGILSDSDFYWNREAPADVQLYFVTILLLECCDVL